MIHSHICESEWVIAQATVAKATQYVAHHVNKVTTVNDTMNIDCASKTLQVHQSCDAGHGDLWQFLASNPAMLWKDRLNGFECCLPTPLTPSMARSKVAMIAPVEMPTTCTGTLLLDLKYSIMQRVSDTCRILMSLGSDPDTSTS